MKATFVVPLINSSPYLPPFDEGDIQLAFTEDGERQGGWWCIGHVPQAPTAIVCVHSTAETIAAMAEGDTWLFIEELAEPGTELSPKAARNSKRQKNKEKKPKKKDKEQIKGWPKAHGHKAEKVDKLAWNNNSQVRDSLRELHGVLAEEYRIGTSV